MALWTSAHAAALIPAIAAMLVIAAVLRKIIGDKPLKIRMIPFQVLACIAAALEIGKQVISFYRGYDLYHIPLHFCSLFIFMLPAMAFCNGKHKQTITAITAAICTALFALMLIYPNLIYSETDIKQFFSDFMSFHTVAFHNIAMFELILILFLNLHTPQRKGEMKAVLIFTVCFCTAAGSMAQILKTNFANFYSCNIPPLEALRTSLREMTGAVPTQLLYVLIVAGLHLLFVAASYRFYCFVHGALHNRAEDVLTV